MKKLTNNQSIFNQHALITSNELTQIIGGGGFSIFDILFPPNKIKKI